MSLFEDAACKGKDTSLWFARPTGSNRVRDPYAQARAICADCPVQLACREYGLSFTRRGERLDGLFGGLDEFERAERVRRERREQRRSA